MEESGYRSLRAESSGDWQSGTLTQPQAADLVAFFSHDPYVFMHAGRQAPSRILSAGHHMNYTLHSNFILYAGGSRCRGWALAPRSS